MLRPVSLKVGAGDFALAAGHRRIVISFVAGPCVQRLSCVAPAPLHWPQRTLTRDDGQLNTVRW
jgi:hypothetical protein